MGMMSAAEYDSLSHVTLAYVAAIAERFRQELLPRQATWLGIPGLEKATTITTTTIKWVAGVRSMSLRVDSTAMLEEE